MNSNQLEEYIHTFYEHQKEEIFKAILDADMLEAAFETKGGTMIFKSAIESITSNVMKIVNICVENDAEQASKKVYSHAVEISAIHNVIQQWSKFIITGNEHKAKAEKLKG